MRYKPQETVIRMTTGEESDITKRSQRSFLTLLPTQEQLTAAHTQEATERTHSAGGRSTPPRTPRPRQPESQNQNCPTQQAHSGGRSGKKQKHERQRSLPPCPWRHHLQRPRPETTQERGRGVDRGSDMCVSCDMFSHKQTGDRDNLDGPQGHPAE